MLMPRYSDQDSHNDNNFIGKHGHASTTVAAHTKMRLLSKVEHNMRQNQQQQSPGQNQRINKLLNTAATANGLVGDVDELLMPMRIKGHVTQATSGGAVSNGTGSGVNSSGSFNGSVVSVKESNSRPERNLWSRAEMLEMLSIMQKINALEQLNDRNVKSEHIFRQIEEIMRSKGFVKKTSIQIWTKWKFLKSTYNTTTRHGNGIPKVVPEEVYRVLCRMLRDNVNSANSSGSGIGSECGNSMDSSSADLGKPLQKSEDNKDELEHPIFGFRLGLVKPEPIDTGYEATINNSKSPELNNEETEDITQNTPELTPTLEHTPFIVTVKSEPEMDLGMDGTNTPPPTAPTSPSPPPSSLEPRDREDRLHFHTSTPLPIPMPPLRVAAFASSSLQRAVIAPTHGVLQIERPAAAQLKRTSLSIASAAGLGPSPGKQNRTVPLHSTSNINFVHPTSKLMLPRKQLPMRIPREISLQPASTRPLKAVPMRETGYSLRPDRMIPDLEQSISPPQSPSPPMLSQTMPKYSNPYPSTSRQAQQLNERKRRMPMLQMYPVPVKIQRSSTLYDPKPNESNVKDDVSAAEERKQKALAEETQRRRQQQDELFKTEFTQLANSMHLAQQEMLRDFFQQQKQFARREHEFQLRQDNLVMTALRKQTDALLRTAKQLLQTEAEEEKVAVHPTEESQQHQPLKETDDILRNILLVEPEIQLQEPSMQMQPEEEDEDEAAHEQEDMEHYDEDDTQYSDDEDQQSELVLETFPSALSEDASNHSDNSQLF